MVEGGQIVQSLEDHGRIVDERRRAELADEFSDGDAGNMGSRGGESGRIGG